jgi:hypothetical protein
VIRELIRVQGSRFGTLGATDSSSRSQGTLPVGPPDCLHRSVPRTAPRNASCGALRSGTKRTRRIPTAESPTHESLPDRTLPTISRASDPAVRNRVRVTRKGRTPAIVAHRGGGRSSILHRIRNSAQILVPPKCRAALPLLWARTVVARARMPEKRTASRLPGNDSLWRTLNLCWTLGVVRSPGRTDNEACTRYRQPVEKKFPIVRIDGIADLGLGSRKAAARGGHPEASATVVPCSTCSNVARRARRVGSWRRVVRGG